ncbi:MULTISPECIES: LysR substrate-binding domain-containing protein [unclassified Luteimonas]
MDRIECMRAFVEAVRAESFAAAARKLDVPRSKVSKQVQSLEQALGVQLLMRTTRSLHLTEAGATYYEDAQEVLASLDEAEERARGTTGIRGIVRCNVPVSFGMRVLTPIVPKFLDKYPEIELQISLTDHLIDTVRGGFDVTIRIADLTDSSLSARKIMPAPRSIVASPEYLARHGIPQVPADLTSLAFLNYGCLQGGITIQLTRGKEVQRVRTRGPVIADNGDFLAEMALAGLGATLVPDFIVRGELNAGRLVRVLEDWSPPPIAVHALFAQARTMPLRLRRFVDFLVSELGGEADRSG